MAIVIIISTFDWTVLGRYCIAVDGSINRGTGKRGRTLTAKGRKMVEVTIQLSVSNGMRLDEKLFMSG